VTKAEPEGEGWWQSIDSLGEAGLPTLYRKAVEAVLEQRIALAA
jgi:A/G-specific adenine glycosylase